MGSGAHTSGEKSARLRSRRRKGVHQILEFGPRRRPGPRPTPAPGVRPNARCIAPLRTDGGTAFGLWIDDGSWQPALLFMVRQLVELDDELEIALLARKHPVLELPLPMLPGGAAPGLAGVLQDDAIDYRTRGFGAHDGPPVAEVIRGSSGEQLTFWFHDRTYVQLSRRLDTSTGTERWYCHVEAKHRELYAEGLRPWMRRWLGFWSWLLVGKWAEPEELEQLGWATTQWHLNSDFVGIEFDREDESDFLKVRKRTLYGFVQDDREDYPDNAWQSAWLETISLGRKTSDTQTCIYRKGDQLRQEKRLEPEKSAYAPLWLALGWKPAEDGDPVRVEFRLRKKGLQFRRAGASSREMLAYDFRNPALLLDETAVRHAWVRICESRRLIQREWTCSRCKGDDELRASCSMCEGAGTIVGSRLERCPTDPRWEIVERAAGFVAPFAIRQVPHLIARLTRTERQHKTWRAFAMMARRVAELDEGICLPLDSREDLAAYFEHVADRLRSGDVLNFESDTVVPTPLELGCDADTARTVFFADELADDARVESVLDLLRFRGAQNVRRLWTRGPPTENEDGSTTPGPLIPTLDNPKLDVERRIAWAKRIAEQ